MKKFNELSLEAQAQAQASVSDIIFNFIDNDFEMLSAILKGLDIDMTEEEIELEYQNRL